MPRSRPRTLAPHIICARPSMKNDRPIVAMNSVICGWLTSGRSTKRSMASASRTIAASVAGSASQNGSPCSMQADERQRREEHHRALREIEHARRLVDQHEAQRDERIHHARSGARRSALRRRTSLQIAQVRLLSLFCGLRPAERARMRILNARRRDRRRSPPCWRALRPACRRRSSCRSRARRRGRRCPSRRPCRARSARSSCRTAR